MKENLAYQVERVFNYPAELLWRAWTDASEIEKWYSPTDLSVLPGSVVSELEPGGMWSVGVDVSKFGFNAYFFGRYTEVVPFEKVSHRLHYTESEVEFLAKDETSGSHLVEVTFTPIGSGIQVRFAQFGEMEIEEAAQAEAGMESYFDNLQLFLAGL